MNTATRIGIDTTALPPQPVGAGRYIIELVRALAAEAERPELVIFAQQHGRELIGLPDLPGVEWVTLPNQPPMRRLVWEQTAFPGLVRRSGVSLLHSMHYTRPLRLPCPSVVTFHDMTFFLFPELHTRAKRLFFPRAIRFSARRADALLAISESTRQDAIRLLGVPPEKITATPLGVNPGFRPIDDPAQRLAVQNKYNLPDAFFLFVGIVEPRKNVPLLLRAYARVCHAEPEAMPLVVAGRPGWGADEVYATALAFGLGEKIHFCGYVSAEDLPIVYNLASVFVYPSRYEGFGLPPLEALACGTPVITTAVSSMPEHVGSAGLLIPPQDEVALAEAMLRLNADAALRAELADRGPRQAAEFTWTRTARQTLAVYQRVLETQR